MGEEVNNYVSVSSSTTALNSSNIGFQLLKKHGWKEGTGLGACLQGRLEPVETYVKKNKRGLGAEKVKKKTLQSTANTPGEGKTEKMSKKEKALSKRMRKMLDEEKRRQENESRQAFFREFWPDNV